MKTRIIFVSGLLLLISAFTAIAQQYESCFGEESTTWVLVDPNSYWGIDGDYSPNYYLIDSIKCYSDYYNKEQPFGIVYFESDENSKLWRWDTEKDEKSVIMNLNWQVGDSIFIDNKDFKRYYNERPFGIVDSVYYDENNRKVIHTDLVLRTDTTYFNLKYIEGIGPNTSVYFDFFWGSSSLLLCAYKDGILTFVNTEVSDDCTYKKPVSADVKNTAPEVLINYHSNTIDLTFNDTFSGSLSLITANGKLIKSMTVNSKSKKIDINDIPTGVYIVQVSSRNGKLCVNQKITKK